MRKDISGWMTRLDDQTIAARRAAGHWRGRTIADDARSQAMTEPERPCVVAEDRVYTVAQLTSDAEALAASLWELGMRPGEVASFQLPNWPEAVVIDLAACMLGLVVNPIVPIYRDAEVGLILEDCGARIAFIPERFRGFDYAAMMERLRPRLRRLEHIILVRPESKHASDYDKLVIGAGGRSIPWPQVQPDAVKLNIYTSGTTGRPKGVLHSHETLTRAIDACVSFWNLNAGDVVLMPSPVTHVTGYSYGAEMPFYHRTRTVLMDRWNADEAVALIDCHRVNVTVGATPFLQELIEAAQRAGSTLPSLRVFACGGAAVPPELIRRALRVFPACRTFRIYGSTEAPVVTLGFVDADKRVLAADTDGRVVDYEVKIVEDSGTQVPLGQEGEILARGPALFLGYTDPEQTAESFDIEGFFRTGDIGLRTPEDALVITGRKKDLIIRGGENLSAKDIEDALHRHPMVKEAAAVAMPHARLGETVCAFVVPTSSEKPTLPALCSFLAGQGMAKQKFPEHLEIVEEFPRTASGKIRKDILRAQIAAIARREASHDREAQSPRPSEGPSSSCGKA